VRYRVQSPGIKLIAELFNASNKSVANIDVPLNDPTDWELATATFAPSDSTQAGKLFIRFEGIGKIDIELAELDGAEDCLVVNSGCTAIFLSIFSQVKSGDHIVAVKGVYTWTEKLLRHILPAYGVTTTWIDGTSIINFEQAIQPNTRLIYLESPTSWVFEEQPLADVVALAKKNNILTVIDNTYFTPIYQKVMKMGVDIAIQSASKYIGGHSDTIAGVICASKSIIEKIYNSEFLNIGAGIMPFNAWLLIRGLRTLSIRLEKIRKTTPLVVIFLLRHPEVKKVLSAPNGFGLLTMILKTTSRNSIIRFCESLQHIPMAVSWGGYESLIMPRCVSIPEKEFDPSIESHRSVRLYIGLEEPSVIIEDLQQALSFFKCHPAEGGIDSK